MRSLRKQTLQTLSKGKSLREILEICEADQRKKDACFPTVQSVKDLIMEKLPGASMVLNRRFDMISIDEHIELARALAEGRCNKYGILVDNYGQSIGQDKIRPFFELIATETEEVSSYPTKLTIDGYAPRPGTNCYLIGIGSVSEAGFVDYNWYPFPTLSLDIRSAKQGEIIIMMTEISILLAVKLRTANVAIIDIVHGDEIGDEDNDEHHDVPSGTTVDEIADLILPTLHFAGIKNDFPRFEIRDDADNHTTFWIETDFRTF